ncbi:Small subunit processome component [Kappamyces sp. JEL0829]|nr:Small subunit processome component [Kappamyces sp. JEL0829]
MNIYCHSFGFRTPYQVILDGNFMQVARATGKNLEEALPDFLGGPCRLMTSYCVYAELKKLGPDFRPTAAMAKKLEKRRCTHNPAVTAAECLKEIMGTENTNRYCVATQDPELRHHLRGMAGVPLLHINKSVLLLEAASKATTDKAAETEIQKTLPQEFEKPVAQSLSGEAAKIIAAKLKKKKEPNSLSVKKKQTTKLGPKRKRVKNPK